MMTSMQEITERFDKIKDHKPKASKKLNELGDILASAYRLDKETASQMWQYIVDLNTADDITNSKFYVAQVFNKLSERLLPEECTLLVTMVPERVHQMVLYGYDGSKIWTCLEILVRGYIKSGAVDDAIVSVNYFYDKYGGANSDNTAIYRIARKAATICTEYIHNDACAEASAQLLELLMSSENQDINSIVEITKTISLMGFCENYEMLFYVTKKCKEPVEFFDLLWDAREQFSIEELRDKWAEYVEECSDDDIRPYNYVREEEVDKDIAYEESKIHFYVELEKTDDTLLSYYFNRPRLYDVEKGVVIAWVFDKDWSRFIKYVSSVIMAGDNDLDFTLKNLLSEFMDACFYTSGMDSYDKFRRSYKELMKARSTSFAEALAQISAITAGCPTHRSYHLFIKGFIQKLNGNIDILNEVGFVENVEKRSPIDQLRAYIRDFNKNGQKIHSQRNTEFSLIMDQFTHGIFDKKTVNKSRGEAYRMACDDLIATFFFTQCPNEYHQRTDMLSSCVIKHDIDRAIKLIDMMATTKDNPGYTDLNGWGRQNMLTLKYLIQLYDFSGSSIIGEEAHGITADMRHTVKELVDRMMPSLPPKSQGALISDTYKLMPVEAKARSTSFDDYITKLLQDVETYVGLHTKKYPRGKKGNTININSLSGSITNCFSKLSGHSRFDVIYQVMIQLASAKDSLRTIPYSRWVSFMIRGVGERNMLRIFKDYPDLFQHWITEPDIKDHNIREVAEAIGKSCSRSDFMSFRNMVLIHKGYIDGLDNCFEVTSKNTDTQLLYAGANLVLKLDYLKIVEYCPRATNNHVCNVIFHILTEKKSKKVNSVRVLSCKVNGLSVNSMGFICDFDDGGPVVGYDVDDLDGVDELTIYPDFFEEHGIKHVKNIELVLAVMDRNANIVETLTPIIIEHNMQLGRYIVTQEAKRQV